MYGPNRLEIFDPNWRIPSILLQVKGQFHSSFLDYIHFVQYKNNNGPVFHPDTLGKHLLIIKNPVLVGLNK
jgi:hypothetical protein